MTVCTCHFAPVIGRTKVVRDWISLAGERLCAPLEDSPDRCRQEEHACVGEWRLGASTRSLKAVWSTSVVQLK